MALETQTDCDPGCQLQQKTVTSKHSYNNFVVVDTVCLYTCIIYARVNNKK